MKIRFKLEIHGVLDTEEFPVPIDGRIMLQLKDEVQEVLEQHVAVEINKINAFKMGQTNGAEVRNND